MRTSLGRSGLNGRADGRAAGIRGASRDRNEVMAGLGGACKNGGLGVEASLVMDRDGDDDNNNSELDRTGGDEEFELGRTSDDEETLVQGGTSGISVQGGRGGKHYLRLPVDQPFLLIQHRCCGRLTHLFTQDFRPSDWEAKTESQRRRGEVEPGCQRIEAMLM